MNQGLIETDSPKRLYVTSTKKRIAIFTELAEQEGISRCDLLNELIFRWVILQVDEDLKKPIQDVFGY